MAVVGLAGVRSEVLVTVVKLPPVPPGASGFVCAEDAFDLGNDSNIPVNLLLIGFPKVQVDDKTNWKSPWNRKFCVWTWLGHAPFFGDRAPIQIRPTGHAQAMPT
jgi:hypothetical protein